MGYESSELADLGVVRLYGSDVVSFLQGQLSSDVGRLATERSQLSGYHNPQGRAIALLRLVHLGGNEVLAVLPRELAATVASRLSKFVLRAKVKITEESEKWRVQGLIARESGTEPAPAEVAGTAFVRVGDSPARWLLISPVEPSATPTTSDAVPATPNTTSVGRNRWRRLDIAAGQPQVYATTSEEFVAQMLNLDALGAIAFDKGCYTGQEVIARAHYRGRVKRRAQRFVSREPCQLAPGDSLQLTDGRTVKIVESVSLPDGRSEFLAVTSLASSEPADPGSPEAPANSPRTAVSTSAAAEPVSQTQPLADAAQPRLDAEQLPLPYALPD